MRKTNWIIASLLTILVSCKESREEKLHGTWQANHLENPAMDQMLEEQLQFLDSFGRSTTAAQNLEIYGSENVDSIRESLSQTLVELKAMQDSAVKNTWFQFRKDGVAMMNFGGQMDSVHWYLNDDNQLVLDEMSLKGSGSQIYMDLIELTDSFMKLRFTEDGLTSTVDFFAVESE